MALENYIRNFSCLRSGILSDLTLNFGDKSWRTHKALAYCHSKWFQKALTIGLMETDSGVVTLKDDPEYADAIDCMVSYFYEAKYDATTYNTLESLLHAQVAIVADKYDCASLYELAKTSFANIIKGVESDEWSVTAAFVYDNTTTEVPAHVEVRDLVTAAVAGRRSALKSALRNGSVVDLLQENATLATDLLLGGRDGPKAKDEVEHIFICDHCHYTHAGSRNCPNVTVSSNGMKVCPECRKCTGKASLRSTEQVDIYAAFSCPLCDGFHTIEHKLLD